MTTEIRVPITISGWVVLRDLHVEKVEVVRDDWAFSSLPYVSPYGDDKEVMVFKDEEGERVEADVDYVQPVRDLIEAHDITAHHWVTTFAAKRGEFEIEPKAMYVVVITEPRDYGDLSSDPVTGPFDTVGEATGWGFANITGEQHAFHVRRIEPARGR